MGESACVGAGGVWEFSVLPTLFSCESKTAPKKIKSILQRGWGFGDCLMLELHIGVVNGPWFIPMIDTH